MVDGIKNAANFHLQAAGEPVEINPHRNFEFFDLRQWSEPDIYCLAGKVNNPGGTLQEYLVIGATLYDDQGNVANFGDYYEPDLTALADGQPLDFEICVDPPFHNAVRHELWAWGL